MDGRARMAGCSCACRPARPPHRLRLRCGDRRCPLRARSRSRRVLHRPGTCIRCGRRRRARACRRGSGDAGSRADARHSRFSMLVDAISRDRRIQTGVWLCLLPALCFGTLSVLAPLRLSDLGWGAAAVGATYLVSAGARGSLGAGARPDSRIDTAACRRFARRSPDPRSWRFSCRGRTAPCCLRCSSSARASRSEASGHPQCHWSPMQRRREGSTTATRSRS